MLSAEASQKKLNANEPPNVDKVEVMWVPPDVRERTPERAPPPPEEVDADSTEGSEPEASARRQQTRRDELEKMDRNDPRTEARARPPLGAGAEAVGTTLQRKAAALQAGKEIDAPPGDLDFNRKYKIVHFRAGGTNWQLAFEDRSKPRSGKKEVPPSHPPGCNIGLFFLMARVWQLSRRLTSLT
jgi:hypothetical protein